VVFFVVVFCGTSVWTQGLTLARQEFYYLSHSSSPFFCWAFSDRVLWTICLGWFRTLILLISHRCPATSDFFLSPNSSQGHGGRSEARGEGTTRWASGTTRNRDSHYIAFPLRMSHDSSPVSWKTSQECEAATGSSFWPTSVIHLFIYVKGKSIWMSSFSGAVHIPYFGTVLLSFEPLLPEHHQGPYNAELDCAQTDMLKL
jgi:hypothetical protein